MSELGSIPLVVKDSKEWDVLEFQLTLALPNSCAATVRRAHDLRNPHITTTFSNSFKDSQVIYCWVRASDAETPAPLRARGFAVDPARGRVFTSGTIPPLDLAPGALNSFILCQVAVGRPYTVEAGAAGFEATVSGVRPPAPTLTAPATPKLPELPAGYDSIIVVPESLRDRLAMIAANQPFDAAATAADAAAAGAVSENGIELLPSERSSTYVVFNSTRVLPLFSVEFDLVCSETGQNTRRMCEVCRQAPAATFCKADNAYLCLSCDAHVHSANALVARHVRVPIDQAPGLTHQFCRHHPDSLVEYFCPKCAVPVCVRCKIEGNHSCGEAATHRLIALDEACALVRQKAGLVAHDLTTSAEKRRSAVIAELRSVDERLRTVYKNSAAVEERLFSMLNAALLELQQTTTRKLSGLLGAESDLMRQLRTLSLLERRFQDITSADAATSPAEFIHRYAAAQRCARQDLSAAATSGAAGAGTLEDADIVIRAENGRVFVSTGAAVRTENIGDTTGFVVDGGLKPADYRAAAGGVATFRSTLFGRRRYQRSQRDSQADANDQNPLLDTGVFEEQIARDIASPAAPATRTRRTAQTPAAEPSAALWNATLRDHLQQDTIVEEPPLLDVSARVPAPGAPAEAAPAPAAVPAPAPAPEVNPYLKYSLRGDGEARRLAIAQSGCEVPAQPFAESEILSSQADALALYFAIPFTQGPATQKIWSMSENGPDMRTMHLLIDGNGSTAVIVRVGEEVFGGFASSEWNTTGKPFGSRRCFLFSLNRDLKIPCRGQVPLCATETTLCFGSTDLCLASDFTNCSSILGGDYRLSGIETPADLLTGINDTFAPDAVEVWNFA